VMSFVSFKILILEGLSPIKIVFYGRTY